jgi:hypothetical protein
MRGIDRRSNFGITNWTADARPRRAVYGGRRSFFPSVCIVYLAPFHSKQATIRDPSRIPFVKRQAQMHWSGRVGSSHGHWIHLRG